MGKNAALTIAFDVKKTINGVVTNVIDPPFVLDPLTITDEEGYIGVTLLASGTIDIFLPNMAEHTELIILPFYHTSSLLANRTFSWVFTGNLEKGIARSAAMFSLNSGPVTALTITNDDALQPLDLTILRFTEE